MYMCSVRYNTTCTSWGTRCWLILRFWSSSVGCSVGVCVRRPLPKTSEACSSDFLLFALQMVCWYSTEFFSVFANRFPLFVLHLVLVQY